MEPPAFYGEVVADFFSADGENDRPISVGTVPDAVKEWLLSTYPTTTYISMEPICGMRPKMEWRIRGWTKEDSATSPSWEIQGTTQWRAPEHGGTPSWEHLVHTQWRKL